jgi:hypothetical protein
MCIKFLQDAVVDLLIQAGLTKFLNFKSGSIGNRRMCGLLTKNAVVHENSIKLCMSDDKSLWIIEDVVQHVLDLTTGSIKELPTLDTNSAADEYQKMYLALKYVVATYKKEKEEKKGKGKGSCCR